MTLPKKPGDGRARIWSKIALTFDRMQVLSIAFRSGHKDSTEFPWDVGRIEERFSSTDDRGAGRCFSSLWYGGRTAGLAWDVLLTRIRSINLVMGDISGYSWHAWYYGNTRSWKCGSVGVWECGSDLTAWQRSVEYGIGTTLGAVINSAVSTYWRWQWRWQDQGREMKRSH